MTNEKEDTMNRITRFRPSPALVVASIALLVALGGTGVAAVALAPVNSVGTRAVINNSLLKQDFKAGQLPAGPAGAPGSALAYAKVNADGTIDPSLSKNVSAVPPKIAPKAGAGEGFYCLDVTAKQAPKNVVATLDISRSAGKAISAALRATPTECADGSDALVSVLAPGPALPTNAFYVVFN